MEAGWVALEDMHSESIGLPHSVRWPWDDSKGIYILSAAHEIHCVVSFCEMHQRIILVAMLICHGSMSCGRLSTT